MSEITVPISEFNVELAVNQTLVYTDDDSNITTETTLHMTPIEFRAMFNYTDGSLTFSEQTGVYDGVTGPNVCSPESILKFALKRQAVSTSPSANANIVDSFQVTTSIVTNASMVGLNILEHCLLQHAADKYSFIQAFVAIDQTSRNLFAKELHDSGLSAANLITSKLTNTTSVAPNLLLNISKLRQITNTATLSDLFQNGDTFFFSVTISAGTEGFKQQYYKCKILLVNTSAPKCVQYGIGDANTLLLIENSANVYSFA
jgi:hypothetical protein